LDLIEIESLGAYSLEIYSLGVYCLGPPILDLIEQIPVLEKRYTGPFNVNVV